MPAPWTNLNVINNWDQVKSTYYVLSISDCVACEIMLVMHKG
jgi:hypothetical protein